MSDERYEAMHSATGLNAEDEATIRELDAEDRNAAAILRVALSEFVGAKPPEQALREAAGAIRAGLKARHRLHRNMAAAAGWRRKAPKDDARCCVEATGSFIAFKRQGDFPNDEDAMLMAIEHDWLGAVIGLVRTGPGAPAEGVRLVEHIDACPEVEGEIDPSDTALMASTLDLIMGAWEAAGAIDPQHRVTDLGTWTLPRALAWAWNTDFDSGRTITLG
ncbi:MAG: hypothetical protein ACRDMV_12555 [Streptosporangiales bacterium]